MTAPVRDSLARAVDAGYGDAWAELLARPHGAAAVTDAAAMVFRVGAEWLAVPLAMVSLVAPRAPVHRIPHRSGGALLGIVSADGRLLPAVSPARLLGIAAEGSTPAGGSAEGGSARHAFARLLVLAEPRSRAGAPAFALPVDEVHGVHRYAAAALLPPAATVGRAPPPLVAGVLAAGAGGLDAGLLDAHLLMTALRGLLR
jgi:chemotaxis-related protein WspD